MQAQPEIELTVATPSLRSRTIRSAAVTLAGQGSAQALRLISNLVLSRLLFPEAFGLMAIVRLLSNGLAMFSDVGIPAAIIRHDRGDDPVFLDTAWTLGVVRGALLFVIAAALAVPVAIAYDAPELRTIIPIASIAALIGGFEATKLISLSRNLTLGRRVGIDLTGQVVALIAMIGFALAYASVWALVVGALTLSIVRMTLSHVAIPGRSNRFRWDRSAAHDLLHFGKWIFLSSFFVFLSGRMDVVLLGRLVPLDVLGVYSVGITVSAIPREVSSRLVGRVLLPTLSEARREGFGAFQRSYRRARTVILAGNVFVLSAAAVASPAFFHYLYDERYAAAGWISQLSMLVLWFGIMQSSAARALLALGNSKSFAISDGLKLVCTLAGCLVGWSYAGLPGLMIGSATGQIVSHAIVLRALSEAGLSSLRQDVSYTLGGMALGMGACGLPRYYTTVIDPTASLALTTLWWGTLFLLPFGIWVGRMIYREVRKS